MRIFLSILALVTLHPVFADEAQRPNIVFILADDLGINDLHCYGRHEHNTPHLDQLAKEGMRFTSAYSAQSVCSPTRAAILTGQTPARLHITTFLPGRGDAPSQLLLHPKINQQLTPEVKTLAERLKQARYASACIGKWHLGSVPTERGFDLYYPGQATTPPTSTEGGKGEFDLTTQAEQFIEQHRSQPFFLYLCHNNPHIPLGAQTDRIKKFADAFNPTYAAMIETLDESVGRVMKKVADLGLAEKTVFVFTSDNGGLHVLEGGQTPTHNTPCRAGKGFLYEGGIRIPLIVRWPGKTKPGTTSNVPVISTDWTPTLLAAAGIATTDRFDGVNLLDVFTQNKASAARPLYWHQPHYMNQGSRPSGAIREGPWKLIEHYENGQLELFNLEKDPGETTDVGEKEAGRVAEMRGKLERWRREIGAQSNTPNPDFHYDTWRILYQLTDVSRLPASAKAVETNKQLQNWRTAMNNALNKKTALSGVGIIMLHPKDAVLHGEKLRHEPEPHKDTVGYWANMNDWAEWKVNVTKPGVYAVELLQAAGKNSGGAEVEISIAGQTLKHTVKETGHFQRFVPMTVDTVRLEAGEQTLTIRAKTKPGFGVMDLRRVTLRGVGEKR